ncbi:MAG TPA: hypothetical protein VNJ09_05580, partial [Chthonomonadales bacterium]|nr:hypothetical protein [Chthonomonadales bacterium]
VGGVYKAWKVVAVDHGRAVVKKDRRVLRLAVGGRLHAGAITVTVTNEPMVTATDGPVVPVAPEEKRSEVPSTSVVPSYPLEQPKLSEDTSSTGIQPEDEPDTVPLPPTPEPRIP